MKKNERICAISKLLADNPNKMISYNYFTEKFGASKTSVCEDVAVVRETFEQLGEGCVETVAGPTGGVRYRPDISEEAEAQVLLEIANRFEEPERRIPGGFIYYSDILSNPSYAEKIGRIIASRFMHAGVEYVVTTETKGISVALESARCLGVPMTVIRRSNRVAEGATTSMNYVSGSSNKIKTMYLSRRVNLEGRRVLILDDFMKGGGTVRGMMNLMEEVGALCVGPCVIISTEEPAQKLVTEFTELLRIQTSEDNQVKVTRVSK